MTRAERLNSSLKDKTRRSTSGEKGASKNGDELRAANPWTKMDNKLLKEANADLKNQLKWDNVNNLRTKNEDQPARAENQFNMDNFELIGHI